MNIILNNAQLEKFCQTISAEDFITIDTEFARDKTYFPKLCLIQIASASDAVLIDPLSPELNLAPLDLILQDPNIVKVFHSAKQDLEILLLFNKHLPKNIFDTQIAASFCGFGESVSYESLVFKMLNIKVDKSSRVSDWTIRPLSVKQIDYALGDVVHLRKIYLMLIKMLNDNKRLTWAMEETNNLNQAHNFSIIPDEAWKKIKNTRGIKINLIIKKLAAWREIKAQQYNLPRNHFLNEEVLFKLAQNMPLTLGELKKIGNFNNLSEEIIAITNDALSKQLEDDLNNNSDPANYKINSELLSAFKLLLKQKAEEYQLPISLIATTQDLKNLCIANNKQVLRPLTGWRYEIFGKFALELKG